MAGGPEDWVTVSSPLCEQAERHLRWANDPVTLARQLNNIGTVLQTAGDLTSARAKLEEAVGLARSLGDTWLMVNNLDGLAGIEFDIGDRAAAEAHWKEALALAGEIRSRVKAMLILIGLALLAQVNGRPRRCLRLLGAAATLQKRMGWVLGSASPAMARALPEAQAAARGLIGRKAADTAWREGGRMSLAEAVRYGLGEPSETTLNPV
jgi:tetratricopeptide (TPR) repeat protein